MLPIILASTSPYRAELLRKLGLDFCCESPEVEENRLTGESAHEQAKRLSQAKAASIAERFSTHYIIGSDQTVAFQGDVLGKPHTHARAHEQLSRFSGHRVDFHTGLTLINSQTGKIQSLVDRFTVHFRTLSHHTIEHYLHTDKPYDCAGSFKSEGLGITLFTALEGKDPNSLVGLPLIDLTTLFANEGVQLPLAPKAITN